MRLAFTVAALFIGVVAPRPAAASEPPLPPAPSPPGAVLPEANEAWPRLTISPGFQMWRAVAATEGGDLLNPHLIGIVVKAQMTVSDMVALHIRGAYGLNSTKTPTLEQTAAAWMVGAGLDMYFALGKRVIWYNTMGLGFQQAWLDEDLRDHPKTHNPGAYFVTTLDITMGKGIGMWMDWGCGVVGPAFAKTAGQTSRTWHINPLGAGGFRFSF